MYEFIVCEDVDSCLEKIRDIMVATLGLLSFCFEMCDLHCFASDLLCFVMFSFTLFKIKKKEKKSILAHFHKSKSCKESNKNIG